jgi:hypothetical protein
MYTYVPENVHSWVNSPVSKATIFRTDENSLPILTADALYNAKRK